jgi:enterobactin synthetase component D
MDGLWRPVRLRSEFPLLLLAGPRVTQAAVRILHSESSNLAAGAVGRQVDVKVPASLAGALVRRRVEDLLAGRACAQVALQEAGAQFPEVGAGPQREPIWPEGWVGSLSHGAGIAWAGVARRADFDSLGLDVEPLLTPQAVEALQAVFFTRDELRPGALGAGAGPGVQANLGPTLLFSAKESIFKCLHPLVKEFIGPTDVQLELADLSQGELAFAFLRPLASWLPRGATIHVRFQQVGSLVFTATCWPTLPRCS